MTSRPRLIEVAFPLRQTSIDSVHEKNVRHGHISTLHIWPARRPLAACRAALIATLLSDPGNDEERKVMLEKLGGKLVPVVKRKKLADGRIEEKKDWETVGGILHWGRESGPDLEWFRQKIREEYGGRAPRVLDPFAGGGAIPLEAMRLGCEVTAADINPVAWFILKCTLDYPQRLAGKKLPLPDFIRTNRDFMEGFFKAQGLKGAGLRTQLEQLGDPDHAPTLPGLKTKSATLEADLAWHVRAWGHWVLEKAREDLAKFYPVFDKKPTVAYLWARTVTCKNCRATIPLLKTRWLCKKDNKRVLLTMEPNKKKDAMVFGIETNVPQKGGNAAQKRENDKRLAQGTMSRPGAWCPCCGKTGTVAMEMSDIRQEGMQGRLGAVMTAVVVDCPDGKEYRLPTPKEIRAADDAGKEVDKVFAEIPFGIPCEQTPKCGTGASRAFSVDGYGFDKWHTLFTPRQLLALGTFANIIRKASHEANKIGYDDDWSECLQAYLSAMFDRQANQGSNVSRWNMGGEKIEGTFARFALPILWDFAEVNPLGDTSGGFSSAFEWVSLTVSHLIAASANSPEPLVVQKSAIQTAGEFVDLIVTDPPYYDAIPYSDLMDFYYIWLRRMLTERHAAVFSSPLAPKWSHAENDGELIDDAARFGGDGAISKANYENGMARVFESCNRVLHSNGRLVIVFAHKEPDAWETLVSAIIRAGFVVDGSWPIQTEMATRNRARGSAALSSSVWLVCKKRLETARPGWDNKVLEEMRHNIQTKLRDFWDAGIRGPDFVWAATGPALEAYSQYPVVKKANEPGKTMEVDEFLRHVRRIVVDFVVGRVMRMGENEETGLDDVTTYYLLHRQDFDLADAPIGPCILYAVSCNLSDSDLADRYDLLARTGGKAAEENEEPVADSDGDDEEGTGSTVRLKSWNQRKRPGMGIDPATDGPAARAANAQQQLPGLEKAAPGPSREIPLIDQAHRLMHLWKAGDVIKVDDYIDTRGLRRNVVFHHLLQALIELSEPESDERPLLESISNHFGKIGEEKQIKTERRTQQAEIFEPEKRKKR